jgi:hypothetical protein
MCRRMKEVLHGPKVSPGEGGGAAGFNTGSTASIQWVRVGWRRSVRPEPPPGRQGRRRPASPTRSTGACRARQEKSGPPHKGAPLWSRSVAQLTDARRTLL